MLLKKSSSGLPKTKMMDDDSDEDENGSGVDLLNKSPEVS
jgi:hypothetical protein